MGEARMRAMRTGACTASEIATLLELHSARVSTRHWEIHGCSAVTGARRGLGLVSARALAAIEARMNKALGGRGR